MSSLQTLFDHAPPHTRAHYTVAGVTYAILINLPLDASDGSPDAHRPRFILRLIQGPYVRELVVTAQDLTVLLASCDPPIPIQEGWALGAPAPGDVASEASPDG